MEEYGENCKAHKEHGLSGHNQSVLPLIDQKNSDSGQIKQIDAVEAF